MQRLLARHSILTAVVVCLLTLMMSAMARAADINARHAFSIPAQPLATALLTFSTQAGIQVMTASADLHDLTSSAVSGDKTAKDALAELLVNTGMRFLIISSDAVAIEPIKARESRDQSGAGGGSSNTGLNEIIVTAQKRGNERLQNVPVPVATLGASNLADNGQNNLQDYFAQIPGFSFASQGNGQQSLAVRGITTTAYANPTVGITIDDAPFGSSSHFGITSLDIDPSDLARIEVLRGPQGTLYGAQSIGGLLRYVTLEPSISELSGRLQVLGDEVDHGGEGYAVRGAVNVPISDTFAIRVSGFTRRDPGYIENITTGQQDVNQTDVYGGRVSALWRPSDDLSFKLSALLQNTNANGSSNINVDNVLRPTAGALQQTGMPATGAWNSEVRFYTATVAAKLGGMDFNSISGYGSNKYGQIVDNGQSFAAFEQNLGVTGTTFPTADLADRFTQEFRLSSPQGEKLEWLAGVFYFHERDPSISAFDANNAATGVPAGLLIGFNQVETLSEYSVFVNLDLHFTDRFDVQFGGRESESRQSYNETDTGELVPLFDKVPASPYVQPPEHVNGNAFTYLLTPRFKISPDIMLYARLASGYRLGGLNIGAALSQAPVNYRPDKTTNYEVGLKGDLFDHALSFDASVFYIDWNDVQLQLSNAIAYYQSNGGSAKSEGLELSMQVRPTRALSISAMASVDNAALTQNLPAASAAFGLAGDRLPYTSRFSASVSADQDVLHVARVTGFVGATVSYVGERGGEFQSSSGTTPPSPTGPRLEFPAYTLANLRAGARYDSWLFNLFINNAADQRGIVGGAPASNLNGSGYYATIIQPRTVGLSVSRSF